MESQSKAEWRATLTSGVNVRAGTESFKSHEIVPMNPKMQCGSEQTMVDQRQGDWDRDWEQCSQAYGDASLLPTLLDRQCDRSPQRVAVTFEGKHTSYRELHQRADALAQGLADQGIGRGAIVGVCAERSLEMVVALLGVIKAGAAYLPLDPSLPDDRLHFMAEDARSPVVLTQAHLVARWASQPRPAWALETLATHPTGAAAREASAPGAEDPIYCIYTSGTTGRPKGVLNHQAGVTNRLQWMQQAYQLTPSDVVLQKTPFSFDVSVWEFFWPLMVGARMVVARPDGHKDPFYLKDLIEQEGVTTLHFVPSMLQAFLESLNSAWDSPLKKVFCSGEALPKPVVHRFFERVPGSQLHNLYGPTEAAVDVSFLDCREALGMNVVPIGRAITNIELLILDAQLQEVPPGQEGELHIGGIGLAVGYLARPELTAEKFIPHPFGTPGSRLYKTGDLAREMPDGNIEYLGRLDHQVKIRGLRIELGEIECCLLAQPSVRDAAALAVTVRDEPTLIAFFVSTQGQSADSETLRTELLKTLPEYMVPTRIVPLEQMPLSSNGKVDRKALTEQALAILSPSGHDGRSSQAPLDTHWQGPIEAGLSQIWQDCLPGASVHRAADFKLIGGTSLTAIRVASAIARQLGRQVRPADLLLNTRFDAQARCVSVASPLAETPTKLAALDEIPFDLTRGQLDLLLAQELDTSGCAYLIHAGVQVPTELSEQALQAAWQRLAERHPMLRARAQDSANGWHGVLASTLQGNWWRPHPEIAPEVGDLQWPDEALAVLNQPMDVSHDGVLRVHWWTGQSRPHLMVLTLHHAFADEASVNALLDDLGQELVAPAPRQASPHALGLAHLAHEMEDPNEVRTQALVLSQRFQDRPCWLPATPAAGRERTWLLPPPLEHMLNEAGQRLGCSLFPLLLVIMGMALEDTFGQAAALIATPFSRRADWRLDDLVTYWLDVRLMNARAPAEGGLMARLAQVLAQIDQGMKMSFVPLSAVAESLGQMGQTTLAAGLMQFGLTWREHPTRELALGSATGRLLRVPQEGARYGLCLHAVQTTQGLVFSIEHVDGPEVPSQVSLFWQAFCARLPEVAQLQALPAPQAIHAPMTTLPAHVLDVLRSAWAQWVQVPPETVQGNSHWFQQGGTSLSAIRMAAGLQAASSLRLDLGAFLRQPTFDQLTRTVSVAGKAWPSWCVGLGATDAQALHIIIPGQGGHAEGLMLLADGLRQRLPEHEAVVVLDLDGILTGLPLNRQTSPSLWALDKLTELTAQLPVSHVKSIVGFSMSGVLALSLAARLGQQQKPPDVFLLDALGPRHFRPGRMRSWEWALSRRLSRIRSWWAQQPHLAPVEKGQEIERRASPAQWRALVTDLHHLKLGSPLVHVHFLRATRTTDHFGMVWRRTTNGFKPSTFASWQQFDMDAYHLDLGHRRVSEVVEFVMAGIQALDRGH